jgi:microcystin-dependent protein
MVHALGGYIMGWKISTPSVGDGVSTFNLPDFRGKVGVGFDMAQTEFNTLGKKGGEKTHVNTLSEIPPHDHSNGSFMYLLQYTGTDTGVSGDASANEPNLFTKGQIQSVGGGQAHNNLQPYVTVNYIIKC